MKKVLLLVMVVILVLGLAGCARRLTNASDFAVDIAENVITIADSYFDGRINASTARFMIRELEHLDELNEAVDNDDDWYIRLRVFKITSELALDRAESDDNILEARNELARGLGMDRR